MCTQWGQYIGIIVLEDKLNFQEVVKVEGKANNYYMCISYVKKMLTTRWDMFVGGEVLGSQGFVKPLNHFTWGNATQWSTSNDFGSFYHEVAKCQPPINPFSLLKQTNNKNPNYKNKRYKNVCNRTLERDVSMVEHLLH